MKTLDPELLRIFASDLEAYSKVCLSIRTKQATIEPLVFNASQNLVHKKLAKQYQETGRARAIILKARQLGQSTYIAARFFRRLHMFPNQEALVLADELDRAKRLFAIYDRFAHLLPPEVSPQTRYVSKQTQLVFDNPDDKSRSRAPGLASSISVETAKDPAAGRSSTINLLHASELAFWDNAADVWVSLGQSVPDLGSEVIIESTANGVGNFFHQIWLAAQEGENGYLAIFLPWWIDENYRLYLTADERAYVRESLDEVELGYTKEGILFEGKRHKLSLEQVAWRRQTIRDKMLGNEYAFRQEYPATPEEAFLVTGSGFFDEEALNKHYIHEVQEPKRRCNLVLKRNVIVPEKARFGYLRVWDDPLQGHTYIVSADTASGRQVAATQSSFTDPDSEQGGRDFSCGCVYDIHNHKLVAQLHGRMDPKVFAHQLALLGKYYASANAGGDRTPSLIVVERNHSSGETVLNVLSTEIKYPNLYYNRRIITRGKRLDDRLGFYTGVETRQPMLDYLAAAIRERAIVIPSKETVREMTTFVRGEDGKPQGQEGSHDDRVIALAIGVFVATQRSWTPPKHYQETELLTVGTSATGLFDYG